MHTLSRLKTVLWYSSLAVVFVFISQVAPFSSQAELASIPSSDFPKPNAAVYAMAVGTNGTLYIGGEFTQVDGQARNHAAAIDASGALTSWNPNVNGTVYSIAVSASDVVLGGSFTLVGGQARANLAKISISGVLDSWNPDPNDTVNVAKFVSSLLLVGGDFTSIDGSARGHLAAFDAAGTLSSWNPDVNDGTVYALDSDGTTVYFGGDFSSVGGQGRDFLAASNATNGALASWNPGGNGLIATIVYSSGILYVGGDFTSVGGSARNSLAAISQAGSATSWNPNLNQIVGSLAISGNVGYATGFFTQVGGQTRTYAAGIDLATGSPTAWAPDFDDVAVSVAVSGANVYVGGNFSSVGAQSATFLASFEDDRAPLPPGEPGDPTLNPTLAELLPSLSTGDLISFNGNQPTYLFWDDGLHPFASTDGVTTYVGQSGEVIQTVDDDPINYPDLIQSSSAEAVLGITDDATPPPLVSGKTYLTGSLINDGGTVYLIIGNSKVAFTNFNAFNGLGYSLKYTVNGSISNYPLAQSYWIDSPDMAHPWSSWVKYNGTVYYVHETGLVGVPSWKVFLDNGGKDKYILPINDADKFDLNFNPNLPIMTLDDARVY